MAFIRRSGFLAVAIPVLGLLAAGQVVKERVDVVNIEVPVRVFMGGEPRDNLQKGDFQLYEDGKLQEINGFSLRRKKMNVHSVAMQADQGSAASAPRYFVLVFRILEYNKQLQKGLDYFFADILRDQDQLLILANDRTLVLNRDVWQVKRREIVDQVLREEAVKARQELEAYFQQVRHDIDQNRLLIQWDNTSQFRAPPVIGLLERYLDVWRDFKRKYLVPDLDKFYNFAHHLEKIKAEKWVLNFYQVEMFPKMKIGGSIRRQIDSMAVDLESQGSAATHFGRAIRRLLETIDHESDLANEFPAEQIGKMLIRVDTTYHCFISRVTREGLSEDLEYKKVASDLENSLREITLRSGGEVTSTGDIGSALHAIEDKEDIYYVLTYAPQSPGHRGKIKIKINDARARLLYDDNLRSDYIAEYVQKRKLADPAIQLQGLSFAEGKLHFNISDFRMEEEKKKPAGQLVVVLRIRDSRNVLVYDNSRSINAREKTISTTIGFDWLAAGRYIFFIEVHDLLGGRTAMDVLPVEI
jgi:hypothetical protein